ncbi:MAG: hypothetical protein RDV48_12885 [Candidatus Eremiobacteraeota bacterium]|nr:hypothetical protein [Candidatus Eremiobacteraeota bacterium]
MWYWWLGAVLVWIMSAACIISTIAEMKTGKTGPRGPKAGDFWGAVAFHGITAILVFWLVGKALGA